MKEWDDKLSISGKQMKSVWNIALTLLREKKFGRHPAQKPLELLRRIVVAHSEKRDLVLYPFSGSGTTGIVAAQLGRRYVGIDIDRGYLETSIRRLSAIKDNPQTQSQ